MFSIFEENYMEINLKNNTRQTSSIKTDALLNSVHNTPHYADMPGHMAFLASQFLSLRLCKSAERVPNTLPLIWPHKKKSKSDRSGEHEGRHKNSLLLGRSLHGDCTVDSRPLKNVMARCQQRICVGCC
jgi:hypothetical protein